jgi:predicted RNase H-like nuclease (RuvC/YqgF family)
MHTALARALLRHRHRKCCIAALRDKIARLRAQIRELSRELVECKDELEELEECEEFDDHRILVEI